MRALAWHGKGDIRCEEVPDPRIEHPRDAIIKVTTCVICSSDLRVYGGIIPETKSGDVLDHDALLVKRGDSVGVSELVKTARSANPDPYASPSQTSKCCAPEGVHRFRAAMSFFKELVEQPDTATIKRELKWLTEQLGPARDLDVLLNDSVKPVEEQEPEAREVTALENDLEDRRHNAFARAKDAVESDRFRKLTLEIALWLAGGTWYTSADSLVVARREISIADFAAGELKRRTTKIVKRSKRLGTLDGHRRHKLRISIKKVRYACEFFASVYEGHKCERRRQEFAAALKGIQSALGKLNDMQIHDRLARRFTHAKPGAAKQAQKAFAIGLLTGREHAEAEAILADATKAARRVAAVKPFWR